MIKKPVLLLIRIYQKTLSFDHGFLGKIFPNTRYCKFTPTCSEYGYGSVERYGVFKGFYLFSKRIVRCNPWAEAGRYDPVP
jgi:uncharacterized protein